MNLTGSCNLQKDKGTKINVNKKKKEYLDNPKTP